MMLTNNYNELGPYAHNLIKNKARQMIGKAGYTWADRDDIEQELALDLLHRLKQYDSAKAKRSTFMACVIEHRILTLLDGRHAGFRDWRACQDSLDETIVQDGEDCLSLLDVFPDPRSKTSNLVFELDLKAALERLPEDLRELWNLLLGSNMHAVARETGIPRATLYERYYRLCEALQESGI